MNRLYQCALIVATLGWSWLAMQAVHELGHVIGAYLSGGRVTQIVLHPATISYTLLAENPNPLLVVWIGPIVGVALPLVACCAARWTGFPGWYLLQFFAGFCLVANGAYVGLGSFHGVGDPGDMLRHGSPIALLWTFGLVTILGGIALWHGLGPYFGLGHGRNQVSRSASLAMVGLFIATILLELGLN